MFVVAFRYSPTRGTLLHPTDAKSDVRERLGPRDDYYRLLAVDDVLD
jgi:hypothetical protein